MKRRAILSVLIAVAVVSSTLAQCPWERDVKELQSSCLCSYNLGHELSVQCDIVDWSKLLFVLRNFTSSTLDLLYVNNSTIGVLRDSIFASVRIHNIQLSGCKIKTVSSKAFQGQELYLKNLNLQDNDLTEVPVESLRSLRTLNLLDLSNNRISEIPNSAFITLNTLTSLKLSDNNLTLRQDALQGLEGSLKNLNLKGTRQTVIPAAIRGMKTLAFLDLSHNSIRELPGESGARAFEGLESLAALNLERNIIYKLDEDAFYDIRETLSSLSLLNNLIPDFPTKAMRSLSELRVLDIGFNIITELPEDAFVGNPSITLLALDGNPIPTIPYAALAHLNNTLRGLSLGGRFMHCDCRVAWVITWIRERNLQVTSRERNPQFCASPPRFRDRGFYSIEPEELTCNPEGVGEATPINEHSDSVSLNKPRPFRPSIELTTSTTKEPTTLITTSTTTTTTSTTTTTAAPETVPSTTLLTTISIATEPTIVNATTKFMNKPSPTRNTVPPWRNQATSQRPSLVTAFPSKNKDEYESAVIVKSAFRQDNSVIIKWISETTDILGFRVVYRLFGDKSFKPGGPLEAGEREFKIKNVPPHECIIVCVVLLEETDITPATIPFSRCREVRTVTPPCSNMDKITIAASAAICGTIVIAVIVFIAASRKRSERLREFHKHKLGIKNGVPIAGLPVNCCSTASPGGPLSSLATMSAFNNTKDWDQISGYSTHSTQRPRMYAVEQPSSLQDDLRSHFSSKGNKTRSVADGQSQHSFSNHSGRYMTPNVFPSNLLATRQDLRQSRQSLAMPSDRMPRGSHLVPHHASAHSVTSSTRRSRPRSRSRDHHRPSSRYSTAGSTHTLNNYCDNSDNWTDHDMEIYMARNPTTRNGLVPL